MLVGIKPTVGRISRYGIIPITADQDTAGPMARTVTDAAILLEVLQGTAADPKDPATTRCRSANAGNARTGEADGNSGPENNGGLKGPHYVQYLKADALKGARIGIPRAFFYDEVAVPGREKPTGGLNKEQRAVMDEAIASSRRKARSSSIRRTSRACWRRVWTTTSWPGACAPARPAPADRTRAARSISSTA